jgi:hypothetical protein
MLLHVTLVRTDISEEHHGVLRLMVTANVVPSSLILFTLMLEAIHPSESSVITRATQHNITEDGILYTTLYFGW